MGSQIVFILKTMNMIDNKSLLLYKFPKAQGLQYYSEGDVSFLEQFPCSCSLLNTITTV